MNPTSDKPGPLQRLVDSAVSATLSNFAAIHLKPDQLAVTLVDLRDKQNPVHAQYRGDVQIYPASVIKLFYLAAAHRQMEDGALADTPELRRAMHDMIVFSYNEATGYVLDLLSGTTSGPELSPAELEQFQEKRNVVNRYFASLGYTHINANKKTWCEGPYGRDAQVVKAFQPPRNFLTTNATARLMTEIVTGKIISAARCEEMKALLKRDLSPGEKADRQALDFIGGTLPPTAKVWSKAGWMSTARHDGAYVELENGARFVLVIFTVEHSNDKEIIPCVSREILRGMNGVTP